MSLFEASRRHLGGAAVLSLVLFSSVDASAHGGIPRAFGIIFEPGNPQHIVFRSDVYGIFRSLDGGKTWNYGCAELYGASWSNATHRTVVVTAGGRILVPNQDFVGSKPVGLGMSDDLCNWSSAPDLAGQFVEEIVAQGNDLFVLTADGVDGGILGQLYKSSDKGNTWTRQGKPMPTDFSGQSLMVAPSNPSRVYVLGQIINSGGASVLESSSDGGTTWARGTGQVTKDSQDWTPRLYGVHPSRPDVVFAWADGYEGLGVNTPDEVWATADGGATWKTVYSGKGDLPGFTFSPDATKVLVSGPLDGIVEATLDDALANGPSAFHQIFDGQVWGLNWTSDGLYAGNNDFTLNGVPPPFTLGVSHDEGHTFEKVMTLCDVSFASCAPNSTMNAVCTTSWSIPGSSPGLGGYKEDYVEGPRCAGPTTSSPDGGTTSPAQTGGGSSGGCGVASPSRGESTAGALFAALAFVLSARRRKRAH